MEGDGDPLQTVLFDGRVVGMAVELGGVVVDVHHVDGQRAWL